MKGCKELTTGGYLDDETKQRELERAYRAQDTYAEHLPDNPVTYPLGPGDGVYVPPDALHLVRNGSDVSISFSVTWRPGSLVRVGRVSQVNGWLREHGRSPAPPGRHHLLDRIKSGLVYCKLVLGRLTAIVRRSR